MGAKKSPAKIFLAARLDLHSEFTAELIKNSAGPC
jgi:hypothetical protein